ncbi:MAG: hypothetical protein OCD01_10690 [Fibrobacterales bacterium]
MKRSGVHGVMLGVVLATMVTTCASFKAQGAYVVSGSRNVDFTIDELVHLGFDELDQISLVQSAE